MKLDIDLVKQIMISLEDGTWYSGDWHRDWIMDNAIIKELSFYRKENMLDRDHIIYHHIRYCIDAKLVENAEIKFVCSYNNSFLINIRNAKIALLGYDFLSSTRKNEVWEKLKSLDFQNLNLTEIVNFGKQLSLQYIEAKLGIK